MTAAASTKGSQRSSASRKPGTRRVKGAAAQAELRQIPLALIDVPGNPARRFLGDIAALADSMQDYGLQQPVSVRAHGDRFVLTSGMRRLAAARMLRWTTITAFVRSVTADDAYLLDLIENLQREDLSAEEEADAFGELIRSRRWTVQQVADSVKRSVAYISKRVRVFEDSLLRGAIASGELPVSTAEVLLAAGPEERAKLVERAIAERWDQLDARDALRPPDADLDLGPASEQAHDAHDSQAEDRRVAPASLVASGHPKGFTHMVREFHRVMMNVRAEDLTSSDRAALRSLFRDLVLLARAPAKRAAPIIPPLPTAGKRAVSHRRR